MVLVKRQSDSSYYRMVVSSKIKDVVFPPRKLLERGGIKPNINVLNFACGAGSYAIAAAEIVGVGGRVFALDMCPRSMLRVRKLLEKKGMTNMQTILSEGPTNLPNGVIDIVFMVNAFHRLEEPDKILAEIHRVLKPDGTFVFTDQRLSNADLKMRVMGGGLFRLAAQDGKLFKFRKALQK